MRFTSVDIECNQPSGKIIQIGAVAYCTDQGLIDTFAQYVDPGEPVNWDHPLNIGCSLEELLAPGFRFNWGALSSPTQDVMTAFWTWHRQTQAGKKVIQWGRGDMAQILKESQGCGYPPHLRVLDLKMAYQFFWRPAARLQNQSGLGTACQQLGVPPPNPAHDALNDSVATGEIFLKMYRQVSAVNELVRVLT